MNLRYAAICLILLPFSAQPSRPAVAADNPLPPTLAKALEGGDLDTPSGWAYRRTLSVGAQGEPATTEVTRWDPSRPAGQQCTLVSVTAADDKPGQHDACKAEPERLLYGELSTTLLKDTSVETLSDNDDRAVYRFVPTGKGHGVRMGGLHVDVDEEDAERMVGTLEVAKTGAAAPYVERVVLQLREPAGNLLAKLKRLEIVYTFAPDAASGAKLLRTTNIELNLSVFTMFNVTTSVVESFDEYQRL